jgi:hypothetical protein
VEHGVGLHEVCEPMYFFLYIINFKLTAKLKEETNLYAGRKVAKLTAQNKHRPRSRFTVCEPVNFFLYFINLKLTVKLKEEINLLCWTTSS